MKRFVSLLCAILLLSSLCVPASTAPAGNGEITILYTNDTHGSIDMPIGYATVAALKKTYEAQGRHVLVADAGDFAHGTVYAQADEGATIIRLMNEAGYDVASYGNHEFDYKGDRCLELQKEADFPFVCCNLFYKENGKRAGLVSPAYKVFTCGNKKVAFVGALTPVTYLISGGVTYADLELAGVNDRQELFDLMQSAADAARKEADYVILLCHLGDDDGAEAEPLDAPYTIRECLAHVSGFDAVINAHSHTASPGMLIRDRSGKEITVTQAGKAFRYIGCMTISPDGKIRTELLASEDYSGVQDAAVQKSVDEWIGHVQDSFSEVFCETEIGFTITDADGKRYVRKGETNLADLCADGMYHYLNSESILGCDVALINGGGVRASVNAGEWNYLTVRTVHPYDNVICVLEMPGRVLREALEFSARFMPDAEFGGLLHSAGLRYEVHTYVPSTVQVNEIGEWAGPPTGAYRVRNIRVFDRERNAYVPLDPDAVYRVAGIQYTLMGNGDGHLEFHDPAVRVIDDSAGIDWYVLSAYLRSFEDIDGDGLPDISSRTSPLADLTNYLLDYEKPTGSRRTRIIAVDPYAGRRRSLLVTAWLK